MSAPTPDLSDDSAERAGAERAGAERAGGEERRGRASPTRLRFVFDYVDPGSYLASCLLDTFGENEEREDGGDAARETGRNTGRFPGVIYHPLEIRTPPRALIDAANPPWRDAEATLMVEAERMGVPLRRPAIVPWSRKAHELALHAREKGCFRQVHRTLFRAHFAEGRDIGRVDVLVEIGAASGLDRTETKAVLDVDRYTERLLDWRREAERTAVAGVPTVLFGAERLEGFSLERLEALLERIIHLSPR